MIWLYRLLFPFAALLSAPHYLRRMLRRGGYGKDLRMRLGLWPRLPAKKPGVLRIWIQAVSVGEVTSIGSLLDELADSDDVEVVLSGTTSTGLHIAKKRHRGQVLALGPFPLDWWLFSALAWNRIRPDVVAMVDSELWPEHLARARKRKVPAVVLNARLSDRSHARLGKLGLFRSITLPPNLRVFASSDRQAERWTEVGIPRNDVLVTGNLKHDVEPDPTPREQIRASLRNEFGFPANDLVLTGISTWPGEETALGDALLAARDENLTVRLLLIPRHAERREEVAAALQGRDLLVHFRSQSKQAPTGTDVYVADVTGELASLIRAADLAFVGKTLPPNAGGQNPIEPAALGLPLLLGPNCQNFAETRDGLLRAGALTEVRDSAHLREEVLRLLDNPDARQEDGQAALAWKKAHAGATQRTMDGLRDILKGKTQPTIEAIGEPP